MFIDGIYTVDKYRNQYTVIVVIVKTRTTTYN